MTDSDYSREVNKMNEHDISIDHSFTTRHLLSFKYSHTDAYLYRPV